MKGYTVREIAEAADGRITGSADRYLDTVLTDISTDSRTCTSSSLFVPIVGERVDAHRFIRQVLDGECICSLSSKEDTGYEGDKPVIMVDDTQKALIRIGRYCRERMNVPLVAVTGSVGKTTTRQMTAAALSAYGKVFETKGNKNSQVGVPVTLFEYEDTYDITVMEAGVSLPGEMTKLSSMLKPDVAVFTNIGISHIEALGSRRGILEEKMHIADSMKDGAYIVLNNENDLLKEYVPDERFNVIRYGLDPSCDVYAEDIDKSGICPAFTAMVRGTGVRVSLSVPGDHQILNALAALAVCSIEGCDLEKAAEAMGAYSGYAHRMQFVDAGDIRMLDDSYNASPDSMKAGLTVLRDIEWSGRKIAVLADMRELGESTDEAHRQIGAFIRDEHPADLVFTYGDRSELIGGDVHFSDKDELDRYLSQKTCSGDLIYFKGSNSMDLASSVDKLVKQRAESGR